MKKFEICYKNYVYVAVEADTQEEAIGKIHGADSSPNEEED